MKSILKWLVFLFLLIFVALLVYQNHGVLFETKTLYLFSADVFGFTYGAIELQLFVIFLICVLLGAASLAFVALGLAFKVKRLNKTIRIMREEELEETLPETIEPNDDLAYHIREDEQEQVH